jgi:hypothetical protein
MPQDAKIVSDILREAARWLEQSGMPMWQDGELSSSRIAADVGVGQFFVAECDGEVAGTVKFQLAGAVGFRSSSRRQETVCRRSCFLGSASVGRAEDTFPWTTFSSA